MAFALDLRKFAERAKDRMADVTRTVVIDVGKRIVQKSPVGNPELWAINSIATDYNTQVKEYNASLRLDPNNLTKGGRLRKGLKLNDGMRIKAPPGYVGGRFRGNWQYEFNSVPTGTLENVDPSGRETISRISASVNSSEVAGIHYIANNLPYAERLENGWSKQAPAGMVGLTVLEFGNIVKGALRK